MTRRDITVRPVWEEYFKTCPTGSFTIGIHSQNNEINPLSGSTVIDKDHVIHGNLRFSWNMIKATFTLYRLLSTLTTTQGFVPPHIQLLSGDSAPLTRCDRFHANLSRKNHSILEWAGGNVYNKLLGTNINKIKQWSTLLTWHADVLQKREHEIRMRWRHLQMEYCIRSGFESSNLMCSEKGFHGALDEFIWTTEMKRLNLVFEYADIMYVDWGYGHAALHNDASLQKIVANKPLHTFIRKVDNTTIHTLNEHLLSS